MQKRIISSDSQMRNKIKVTVFLELPSALKKEDAPAMGDSVSERDENIMKFAEELLFPQYFNAMKSVIETYEKSKVPLRWIRDQKINIAPMYDIWGDEKIYAFISRCDASISIDNDVICSIVKKVGSGAYVFGTMIGKKILMIKKPKELLEEMQEIIPTFDRRIPMNEILTKELFSALVGEIVSEEDSPILSWVDEEEKNFLKNKILNIL